MTENSARVAWAGVGLMLPWRLLAPAPLRWAGRQILGDPTFAARAAGIAAWSSEYNGSARGADLVAKLAAG
jgi:UDP:flavonoid glycosyltransferase YjiC (YdhE family)